MLNLPARYQLFTELNELISANNHDPIQQQQELWSLEQPQHGVNHFTTDAEVIASRNKNISLTLGPIPPLVDINYQLPVAVEQENALKSNSLEIKVPQSFEMDNLGYWSTSPSFSNKINYYQLATKRMRKTSSPNGSPIMAEGKDSAQATEWSDGYNDSDKNKELRLRIANLTSEIESLKTLIHVQLQQPPPLILA